MRVPGPEALLELTRGDAPPAALESALDAFSRFLLLHLSVREAIRVMEGGDPVRIGWAVGFGLALCASFYRPWLRGAMLFAGAMAAWKLVHVFPGNSNHFFLELLCLGMLGLRGRGQVLDAPVVLASLRWVPVLVLFWSGMNKLLYGTYFNGAFLAAWLPNRSFAFVFGFVLPEAELQALLATDPPGPFAFSSWPALVMSNAVWIGEIASAGLLLVPRLRWLGLAAACALLVGIEAGAREFLFGFLMLNLLALFQPAAWSVRLLPASAAVYAALLATRTWIAPGWVFN